MRDIRVWSWVKKQKEKEEKTTRKHLYAMKKDREKSQRVCACHPVERQVQPAEHWRLSQKVAENVLQAKEVDDAIVTHTQTAAQVFPFEFLVNGQRPLRLALGYLHLYSCCQDCFLRWCIAVSMSYLHFMVWSTFSVKQLNTVVYFWRPIR